MISGPAHLKPAICSAEILSYLITRDQLAFTS